MKKVMLVFGTRPEAIKMCPIIKTLKANPNFKVVVCVSGQHREMLEQVLRVFNVDVDYDLQLMKPNQSLNDVTSGVLLKLKPILEAEKPDIVLVHGDTTTTLAAAITCFYQQIKVGHVEAGLRTYDLKSPFPEEFNRQGVGLIADLHFAPTQDAYDTLISEGKDPSKVFITGNSAIDALQSTITDNYHHELLEWSKDSKLVMLTAHRRENLGEPLANIFKAIRRVVDEYPDLKVIYPIHLNPKVRASANTYLDGCERIRLVEPLEVIDFHNFLARAHLILTDSGGIQEEAPSLGKPVLVLRDTTERPEGVKAGTLKLVGSEEATIYKEFKHLLEDELAYQAMSQATNPYGDGKTSQYIMEILERELS